MINRERPEGLAGRTHAEGLVGETRAEALAGETRSRAASPCGVARCGRAILAALVLVVVAACTAAGSDEGALKRGDEAFARGDFSEALAEYRLVLRQGRDDVDVLTRAAHAYARVGRIDEARNHYREAIRRDPSVADVAAADLLRVARRATQNQRDGILAAAAVEAATELRPGVSLAGLARPLADHFSRQGQYGRALPYYQKAMSEGIQDPVMLLAVARAHEELGDCELALTYLERIHGEVPPTLASEVDWRLGECAFVLGQESVEQESLEEALEFFQVTIDVGEPRGRLGQAWYEVGEVLARVGRCTEAVAAFETVRRQDLVPVTLLRQAETRIDDIRFRRGADGPC